MTRVNWWHALALGLLALSAAATGTATLALYRFFF